jgi:peptide/nickel transport system substrate-binding protein
LLGWASWAAPARAKTFRWAASSDADSLYPYSRRETFQLSFLGNIYEPLVRRGRDSALEPALATDWAQAAPLVWRFHLRRSVRFQDGSPFSADDVVFSFIRATSESSKLGLVLSTIQSVRKVDAYTVDIVTNLPDPILPQEIVSWDIMSKAWCEQNDAASPADLADDQGNYAVAHANGTGPFWSAHPARIPCWRLIPPGGTSRSIISTAWCFARSQTTTRGLRHCNRARST